MPSLSRTLLLSLLSSLPALAQPTPTLDEALSSPKDLYGELALRLPTGPTYDFFAPLLPPLRYVNSPFRHYPIALSAPRAPFKARLVSNGSGINLPGEPNSQWFSFPLGLTFSVGPDREMFGSNPANLQGPTFHQGYLPIVQIRYRTKDATVTQESFVPTEQPFADRAAIFVRFSLPPGTAPLPITLTPSSDTTPRDNLRLDKSNRALLWLSADWKPGDANRITATLTPERPLILALFNQPLENPSLPALDDAGYQKLRASCAATWQSWIDRCARLDVPEERVNRAWKSLVIANLMIATGDQMSYSSSNGYHRLYEAESGDALRALLLFGLTDTAKAMTNPLLRYTQQGLSSHDAAFKLQLLSHIYWITRDADFVRSRRDLWQPSVDHILAAREKSTGLLPKENYCGDIATQVHSLNSNANCWRALRDIAAVLRDTGDPAEADRLSAIADEFRATILAALAKSERRDVTPTFIPIALFGEEKPYAKLTDTKLGSYWNLMIPYVLGSHILDDERTQSALDYLHTRGGTFMGMIRFHQHSGLFANEDAVDDLYGLRYVQALLRRDDPDRALVSFYGKLAHGLTPDTFVGGEGTGLRPLDPHGRAMYLPPNSSGNAFFLNTLRELLLQDHDADNDGTPDSLRLLFATPRPWLADGKSISLQNAPSSFGPLSLTTRSDLPNLTVTVHYTPPPRSPKSTQLRLRLPTGFQITSAQIDSTPLPPTSPETYTLPNRTSPYTITFSVRSNDPKQN